MDYLDSNILQRPKLFSIEEIKSTPEDPKDFSTYLIEELNSCIGWNLIPLKRMIQLAVKVAVCSIPNSLAINEYRNEDDNPESTFHTSKSILQQISKSEYLERITQGLVGIDPNSIFGFTLDFDSYNFLYEMLVLSVKISFAGDEINEKEEWKRIIHEIWSIMWNWNTLCKIYSFLLFVKYKLQNKVNIG